MDGQVTWLDLGISYGKTSREPSVATKEKTSRQFLKKSSKSSSRKPPVLKCLKRAGQIGEATTMKWEDDGVWYGALTTANTGEKQSETAVQEMCSVWGPHSVAEESRLSQILEETPHPKYNLTAKACQGILRRAERRGKELPKLLKEVLIRQSQGASLQEQTEAPAPTEDPTSYAVPTPVNLMVATRCEALGRGTGFGVGEPGDPANTISAAHSHGVFATAIPINDKATRWQGGGESRNHDGSGNGLGVGKEGDPSPTLTAGDRHGVLCAGFKLGNSEQARSIGYQEELSPTLNAECGGNKPAVVAPTAYSFDSLSSNSMKSKNPHSGCREAEVAKTLDTTDPTPSKNQGGIAVVAPALPLTYQMNGFGDYRDADVASSCKQRDFKDSTDLVCSMTPDAAQAVLYQPKSAMEENWAASETKNALRAGESKVSHAVVAIDCRNGQENDVGGALQARTGHTLNANGVVRSNMVVRRLTPLECERLQGFPDKWTDIGEWTDEKGKKHKDADSPRYKALGNSIALPFWEWMLRRMARYLPEGATLGSLFDGIGGYPLIWQRIHGKGTARWASEIEQFPIAVTKEWFGEE